MVVPGRIAGLLAVAALSAALSTVLQDTVGERTFYHPRAQKQRAALHDAIVSNDPTFEWVRGARTTNVRVATVFLAEALRRTTGAPLGRIYEWIGGVALWLAFVALFYYLRAWVPPAESLVGVLYLAAVLPLTYDRHWFHPWDRPALLAWIGLAWLLRAGRLGVFCTGLVVAVANRYDALLLPGLYWLANVGRHDWPRVTRTTLALAAVGLATYAGLRLAFPGGFAQPLGMDLVQATQFRIARNLADLRADAVTWPPLLVFGLPLALAFHRFRDKDRFARASVVFGLGVLALLFGAGVFAEVRSQMQVLALILPAALLGLRSATR